MVLITSNFYFTIYQLVIQKKKHFIQNMKEHNYRPKMICKQGQNGTLATKLNPPLLCVSINIVNRNLNTQYIHVAILKYSYNYESDLIFKSLIVDNLFNYFPPCYCDTFV